jgi:hypothetical protein
MVGPVISVITMLDAPSLAPTAESMERCSLFCASRSLGDAADNRASLPDVVLYSSWHVDDFRSNEHRVDRLSVRSFRFPAVKGNNLLDATVVDGRERFTHSRRPITPSESLIANGYQLVRN